MRLTAKGVEFIYKHDSPRNVLEEMRRLMDGARAGVPNWLNAILAQLRTLSKTFGDEMQRYLQRLDALSRRMEEALRRSRRRRTGADGTDAGVDPLGTRRLTYLDRRKQSGSGVPCPLPELFAAVRKTHPYLSVPDFQKGLKRLADNRALTLLPFVGNGRIPEPEHAIPERGHMLYMASR